jgi:hypothetical protein
MNKHTRSVSLIDGHTEEMTDAEIIKALECLGYWGECKLSSQCPYYMDNDIFSGCDNVTIAKQALDLINRQQAQIQKLENIERFATKIIEKQDAEIEKQPTADVVEVKHGEWIKNKPNPEMMKAFHDLGIGKGMTEKSIFWTCSCCGTWGTPRYKYCQECGAKMDVSKKEISTGRSDK